MEGMVDTMIRSSGGSAVKDVPLVIGGQGILRFARLVRTALARIFCLAFDDVARKRDERW